MVLRSSSLRRDLRVLAARTRSRVSASRCSRCTRSTPSLMSSISRRLICSVNSIFRISCESVTRARIAFHRARRNFFLSFLGVPSSFSTVFS